MASCSDTMWPLNVPNGNITSWGVTCAVIAPLIVIFNVILIHAMIKTKETVSFTSRFVVCMSISDIGTGVVVLPLLCSMLFVESLGNNCRYQKVVQCIAYCFGNTSFFMLMAIGVDRYLLITKLLKYRSIMNNFRLKIVVSIIVVTSTVFATITVLVYSFPLHLAFILNNTFCIGGIYVLYAKLLLRVDKQSAAISKGDENVCVLEKRASKKIRRRKRDISVARTIRLLLGTIFLLYMPYTVISLFWAYYKFQLKEDPGLALNITAFWSYMFLFFNCMTNVLIYGYGNSKIRRYVLSYTSLRTADKSTSLSRTAGDSDSEMVKTAAKRSPSYCQIRKPSSQATLAKEGTF